VTCAHTTTLGVYLLGALEPPDRSEFESHLAGCGTCRTELVRLAPLPGLLHQISPEDFEDGLPPAPAEPLPVTVSDPQPVTEPVPVPSPPVVVPLPAEPPRRPRRYWQAAAAGIVLILVIGGIFGWQALRHDTPPAAEGVVWTGSDPNTGVGADVRLVDREWGTEFEIKVHGAPPDRGCYLVVYDHYGNREVTGWWKTNHDPNDAIPASSSIRRSKIEKLEFKLDDEQTVVLTIPHGGNG
jgi:putative zinc finger protein